MQKTIKVLAFAGAALIVLAMPVFAQNGGGIFNAVAVPEPSSIMMLVSGLGAVAGLRYYKLRRK
jgi:PEP-CTERM motif